MLQLYNYFLNILAPPFCAYCKEFLSERIVLCNKCSNLIQPVISTTINLTTTVQMKVFAVSDYQDPIKRLILAKNFSDHLASQQLAKLIWQHTYFKHQPCDLLVPIPLHWTRYAYRGYNQAHQMAQMLGTLSGKQTQNILKRVRQTKYQASLAQEARAQNVREVFALDTTAHEVADILRRPLQKNFLDEYKKHLFENASVIYF